MRVSGAVISESPIYNCLTARQARFIPIVPIAIGRTRHPIIPNALLANKLLQFGRLSNNCKRFGIRLKWRKVVVKVLPGSKFQKFYNSIAF